MNQQLPGKLRADDWNAKIAQTSDELEKLLQTEKKVVLAPVKSDFAADMWALLKAFPTAKATLVLPESFPVHELSTSLDSTSCIARVPMLVRGAIVQPKVCLLTKGGADAPQFDRKEVSIKSDAKKVETVFLRAATRRDLVANFERLQRNPGQSVRSWIQWSKSCPLTQVGDTWGWNLSGQIVSGVMRVDLRAVPALLRASGQRHQCHRWYFEPLRFDAPLSKPFDKLPETHWVQDVSLTMEQKAAKAEKQAVLSDLGVRLGTRHVGVRQIPSSSNSPRPRIWKATGIPRFMGVEDIENVLTSAGFSDFEPLEKFRWRQYTGYTFKALRSDDKDVLTVKYGETPIEVCTQGRRQQQRRVTMPLPGERRVHFGRKEHTASAVEVEEQEVPATIPDTPMEEKDEDDAGMEGATKRAQSTSPEKQPPKKLKADTSLRGFTERSNPGNGDCLFWSLSQSLEHAGASSKTPLQCRAACVAHLTKYAEAYSRHWDGCHPQQGDHVMQERKFEQYLEEVGKPQAWGSALEVTAFSNTQDRPIYVVSPADDMVYVFNRNGQRKALFLKYDKSSQHYTSLIPDSAESPPSFTTVCDGPHVGLRGAAKSSSAGTRISVQKKLKQKLETQSAGTRTSVRKRLGGRIRPGENQSISSAFHSQAPPPLTRGTNGRGHDGPPDSLSEVCTWHCPVCMRTLRAKQFSLLSKKRN